MSHRNKILVIEALDDNRGNKRMAMRTIECLSQIAEVTVATLPDWFTALPDTVKVVEYNILNQHKIPQVTSLVRSIKHLKMARELDKSNHYDFILFLSYHTVGFYLAKIWFKKSSTRLYITHHVNIDDLGRSKIKDYFFRRYARRVNHFVFEPFIKKFLVERYQVSDGKVFIFPHPRNKYDYKGRGMQYDCLGISGSNDEGLIGKFIEEEKSNQTFKNNGFSILLRSKQYEFDDGYLKVINAHFTDDEYYGLYKNALSIILLFPETFKYRMSGSIIDALSNRKRVLLTDIPLFRDYASRYPSVCRVGHDLENIIEFIKQIKNEKENSFQSDDWDRFSEDHSNENIIKSLCKAFSIREY